MKQKRPVNLDLFSLKYPPMAIASILHRVTGLILFLLFPLMLYWLDLSLRSESTYFSMTATLTHPFAKLMLWVFSAAFGYHVLAGIRHIIMDMGFAEGLKAGRRSAVTVIILAAVLAILLGICIW